MAQDGAGGRDPGLGAPLRRSFFRQEPKRICRRRRLAGRMTPLAASSAGVTCRTERPQASFARRLLRASGTLGVPANSEQSPQRSLGRNAFALVRAGEQGGHAHIWSSACTALNGGRPAAERRASW
jgi:hypothetical protein